MAEPSSSTRAALMAFWTRHAQALGALSRAVYDELDALIRADERAACHSHLRRLQGERNQWRTQYEAVTESRNRYRYLLRELGIVEETEAAAEEAALSRVAVGLSYRVGMLRWEVAALLHARLETHLRSVVQGEAAGAGSASQNGPHDSHDSHGPPDPATGTPVPDPQEA